MESHSNGHGNGYDADQTKRPAYFAARVERYRALGFCYGEASTMASMDANDKFGPVKLKSTQVGY